jgi:hypothetical protein
VQVLTPLLQEPVRQELAGPELALPVQVWRARE